jgi:hypothetical protein
MLFQLPDVGGGGKFRSVEDGGMVCCESALVAFEGIND